MPSWCGPAAARASARRTLATAASPILRITLLMISGRMPPLGFSVAMISPTRWSLRTAGGASPSVSFTIRSAALWIPSSVYLRTSQCSALDLRGPGALRLAGLRMALATCFFIAWALSRPSSLSQVARSIGLAGAAWPPVAS